MSKAPQRDDSPKSQVNPIIFLTGSVQFIGKPEGTKFIYFCLSLFTTGQLFYAQLHQHFFFTPCK